MSNRFEATRRQALLAALGGPVALAGAARAQTGAVAAAAADSNVTRAAAGDLRPGDFIWRPEIQPYGAVALIVSIPEQVVHVYRNGVRIAASTCSTGKPGHDTPTGVFLILQKDKDHRSNIYNNAPMPNMQRLTWSGVALHAGNLPGYPASHGCVRLPMAFSEKLWTVTHLGTPVIVSGAHGDPYELTHPGPILMTGAETAMESELAAASEKMHPKDWEELGEKNVMTLVVSSADKRAALIENNRVVAESDVDMGPRTAFGDRVLMLSDIDAEGRLKWTAVAHSAAWTDAFGRDADLLSQTRGDPDFMARVHGDMHPGMVVIFTDGPLHPHERDDDFVIMS